MNRYSNVKKIKDEDGKSYYSSITYPKIKRHSDDIYIIVGKLDRLDLLANKYYQDVTLWWLIAHANTLPVASLVIGKTMRLRIPNPNLVSTYINQLEQLNKE